MLNNDNDDNNMNKYFNLDQQISILESFLYDHMTLKTENPALPSQEQLKRLQFNYILGNITSIINAALVLIY